MWGTTIMTMSVGISFIMIILPALVFRHNICCRRLIEAFHETAPEQVFLQLSGIRVDQSLKFATSTRTSYLAPVAPNHFRLRFFLVAVDSSGVHLDDHGSLRGIEYVLLTGKSKCSTKNFGMTFPKSRTYVVQKCTETEVNQHFGKHPCTMSAQRNNMHNTHNLYAYTYP